MPPVGDERPAAPMTSLGSLVLEASPKRHRRKFCKPDVNDPGHITEENSARVIYKALLLPQALRIRMYAGGRPVVYGREISARFPIDDYSIHAPRRKQAERRDDLERR